MQRFKEGKLHENFLSWIILNNWNNYNNWKKEQYKNDRLLIIVITLNCKDIDDKSYRVKM